MTEWDSYNVPVSTDSYFFQVTSTTIPQYGITLPLLIQLPHVHKPYDNIDIIIKCIRKLN